MIAHNFTLLREYGPTMLAARHEEDNNCTPSPLTTQTDTRTCTQEKRIVWYPELKHKKKEIESRRARKL